MLSLFIGINYYRYLALRNMKFYYKIRRFIYTGFCALIYLGKSPFWIFYCALSGVRWSWGWKLKGRPLFRCCGGGIVIGERFTAHSCSKGNSIGVSQPVIISAWGEAAQVVIGDDVGVSGCSISAMDEIRIGNRVLIGTGAFIIDSDAHPLTAQGRLDNENPVSSPIIIGDDVFIGARAIILKGTTIGAGAVIGAGSVVVHDVESNSVVGGNPAKVLSRI